jgi:hypothetical protein
LIDTYIGIKGAIFEDWIYKSSEAGAGIWSYQPYDRWWGLRLTKSQTPAAQTVCSSFTLKVLPFKRLSPFLSLSLSLSRVCQLSIYPSLATCFHSNFNEETLLWEERDKQRGMVEARRPEAHGLYPKTWRGLLAFSPWSCRYGVII